MTEELSSNIINYEDLVPVVETDDEQTVHFSSVETETTLQFDFKAEGYSFNVFERILKYMSPPKTENIHYSCLLASCLTNRPPPFQS